jgi:6-phosphogluconolactonase (cycloisomerase 2 family)
MARCNRCAFFSLGFSIVSGISVLILGGCTGSPSAPPPVTLTSIAVTPANAMVALGTNQAFAATGMYSDGSTKDLTATVTWSSTATSVVVINNSPGRVAVANPRAVGTTTITATSGTTHGSTGLTIFALTPRFAFIANAGDDTLSTFTVDASTGQLRTSGYRAAGPAPKSVRLHPNGKFLYAGNGGTNTVSAYSIGSDGRLSEIAQSPFATSELFTVQSVEFDPSGKFLYVMDGNIVVFQVDATTGALTQITGSPFKTGDVAIAAVIDATGKFLYAANNHANTVSAFSVDATTGALSSLGTPIPVGPSPNDITMDPSGKFLFVANTGVNNVSAFTQDAVSGALTPVANSPFATSQMPIHLTTDPGGNFLFVSNSFDTKVNMFAIDPTSGALTKTADGITTFGGSWVETDPGGQFVYAVNGNSETVSEFRVDAVGSTLVNVERSNGRMAPSAIAILGGQQAVQRLPHFLYAANNASSAVSAFSINATTGALSPLPGSPFPGSGSPTSVSATPDGRFVYATDFTNSKVTAYAVDPATGVLAQVPGSPFLGANAPVAIAVDLSGRFVYTVNQSGANVSGYAIQSDGSLAALSGSPFATGNGPVELAFSPSGRFLITANSADATLQVLNAAADGTLSSTVFAPTSTAVFPRSVAVDPTSSFVYTAISSSFAGDSTSVDGYQFSANGAMVAAPNSPFDTGGKNIVGVAVHPSGRFVYTANNGFGNQINDKPPSVGMFLLDSATGNLSPISGSPLVVPDAPLYVTAEASGKFLYVLFSSAGIGAYAIDPNTGALSAISGSPFPCPQSFGLATTYTIQ